MEYKSFESDVQSSDSGIISGYASVFDVLDCHGDIIRKGAFDQTELSKVKFLWQHQSDQPIGYILEMKQDDYGLYVKVKLLMELQKAQEAYAMIKSSIINAFSIGFTLNARSIEHDVKTRIIKKIDLWEISLVTFPANQLATITSFKNIKGKSMTDQENFAKAWHEFKSTNDQNLQKSDPLLQEKLYRINQDMDKYSNRLKRLETSVTRPSLSVARESNEEYGDAFCQYLRKGYSIDLEQKALSASSDPDGGFLVTEIISRSLIQRIQEISPFRQMASCETISTDALDIIDDIENAAVGWTGESDPRKDTSTPKVNKRKILVHELYAQPKATQKLIDDSFIDIERWLAEKLVDSFASLENASFINGDGVGKPRGILSYKDGKNWGEIEQVKCKDASLTADAIFNLYFSMKETYAANARFLMNRSTMHQVRTLKDNSGRYLWSPALLEGSCNKLLGVPVAEISDMPLGVKGALTIALGDFKRAYKIVDRAGVKVLRDPFTEKPFVKFYTTKRVGGDVVNFDALKLLALGA